MSPAAVPLPEAPPARSCAVPPPPAASRKLTSISARSPPQLGQVMLGEVLAVLATV
jgi:hypothetical protein